MMEKVIAEKNSFEFDSAYIYNSLVSDFTTNSRLVNQQEDTVAKLQIHELEIGVLLGLLNNGNVRQAIREIIRLPEGSIRGWLKKMVVHAGVIADLVTTARVEKIRIATPTERAGTRVDFFLNERPVICRNDQSSPPRYAFYSDILDNIVPNRAILYRNLPKNCEHAYEICKRETNQFPLILLAPYSRVYYGDTHLYIN